jgi:hypothetical protein
LSLVDTSRVLRIEKNGLDTILHPVDENRQVSGGERSVGHEVIGVAVGAPGISKRRYQSPSASEEWLYEREGYMMERTDSW